jgi:ribosome-binding factor A
MRNMPDLKFQLDTRFDDDARIGALLRSPDVARDLPVESDDGSDEDAQ